ncbi:allantoate deiminase [Priestia endophytica]|nr:allantoate deiminase [Priestia endophytica]
MVMEEKKKLTLAQQTAEMVEWLASFGGSKSGGVTRLLYSESWKLAQEALKARMEEASLHAYYDDAGNLFGRLEGSQKKGRAILTGSHIDTVANGGKYDGAYGIIAGVLALKYLHEHYGRPKKTIEVVSLCEEEGSRFPMTYWGSGSMTGLRSFDDVYLLKDQEGTSFIEAMEKSGFGKGKYQHPGTAHFDCFIELHIEQGEVLERENKSIGVVSHIVGQRRYNVTVNGESNHAGTTPMKWRKDAMNTASALIQVLMEKSKRMPADLVVTVGQMIVEPNIPNVIPNKVTFSIDIRHSDSDIIQSFCQEAFESFEGLARERGTSLDIHKWMDEQPIKMCEKLNELSTTILQTEGTSFKEMTSGAGHDSQVFGQFIPTSLLFVPSHKGISHSPHEFTKTEDLEKGINLLIKILHKLAY